MSCLLFRLWFTKLMWSFFFFFHKLQPSLSLWLSTLIWQIQMSMLDIKMISSDTKCFNTCLAQTKGKFVFAASVDIKQCCKFSNFFLPKIKIKLLKFPVAMHGFLLHVVEMKGISSSLQQQHFVVYHFECHCILSLTFFFT